MKCQIALLNFFYGISSVNVTLHLTESYFCVYLGKKNDPTLGSVLFYKHYFKKEVNPRNLRKLLQVWSERSEINISREKSTLKIPTLIIAGESNIFVEVTSEWCLLSRCLWNKQKNPSYLIVIFDRLSNI